MRKTFVTVLTTAVCAVMIGSGQAHARDREPAATAKLATIPAQLEALSQCVERKSPPRIIDFYDSVFDAKETTRERTWMAHKVTMFGDMDGGMARTVLSGVRGGIVRVPPEARDELCELLVLEAKSIRGVDKESLAKYQADEAVGKKQRRLLGMLEFRDVKRDSVVWLGDITFDRLTNNLPVMDALLRQLHKHGAILIMGNHEEYYKPGGCTSSTWACLAWSRKDYTVADHDKLMNDVFVKAYYDADNRLLYTHNGVRQDGDALVTAFGTLNGYRSLSPQRIASWIREQPVNRREFTNFRPSDPVMEFTELLSGTERIRQVHGHNSCFNVTYEWVIAMNPRFGPRCGAYTAAAWTLEPRPAAKAAR